MTAESHVALVTGASRGIGRASAIALARAGSRLAVNYREDKDGAEETVRVIEESGGIARAVRADVRDAQDVEEMFSDVEAELGPVGILVANAGATRDNVLAMMRDDDWASVIDINLTGVYRCVKRALKPMLRRRWGRIIAISSVAGLHGNVGQANYCAAKAGEIGLIRSVARETARSGVTANVVAPGYVRTALFDVLPEHVRAAAQSQVPMGRLGEPEDVAEVVAFLASRGASYVTGSVVVADGGLSS